MYYSYLKKFAAWSVHVFTVFGIFLGFLALLSTINYNFTQAVFFLALALFVDGIDGTIARYVGVENITPTIDGSILDNIIDYFNYVLVPTFMIHWFGFVGGELFFINLFSNSNGFFLYLFQQTNKNR